MITEPTVLVLGAGASEPYGFPIGTGLKDVMLKGLSNEVELALYRTAGFNNEAIADFKRILQISPYGTIDAILSFRPSLAKIGKFAIVKALSVCQQHDRVFPPKDWYHLLFNLLELENKLVPAPPLTILTYNYDNSLEYFFETIIDGMYETGHQELIRSKYEEIRIIHLHGRLGPYPQGNEDPLTVLSRSVGQSDIRVISDEALDQAEEFKDAFAALTAASKIIFLGFGFAELNLRRLRVNELDGKAKVFGTGYNMNQDIIKKAIGREIQIADSSFKCADALRSWKGVL